MSTVPALFRRLVDDAALFPPGNAPMERAVIEHAEHRRAPYARAVGRFLCRETRVAEWASALDNDAADQPVRLAIIADSGAPSAARTVAELRDATASEPRVPDRGRVVVDVVELPIPADGDLAKSVHRAADVIADVRLFVEIPLVPGWRGAVAACADAGVGAKLRTGGLTESAFPNPRGVADFIAECVGAGVPFKCTAGLHRAVCHTEPETGFHHHGFLNILVATHAAITSSDVFSAVTARDAADLAAVCWGIDDAAARTVRTAFVGFGSCSVAEPLADLAALGLIDADLVSRVWRAPQQPSAARSIGGRP